MRKKGVKKNEKIHTLYKINNTEPIWIRVSTSNKIESFVNAFIRGKKNSMHKYTLYKINSTEPI